MIGWCFCLVITRLDCALRTHPRYTLCGADPPCMISVASEQIELEAHDYFYSFKILPSLGLVSLRRFSGWFEGPDPTALCMCIYWNSCRYYACLK